MSRMVALVFKVLGISLVLMFLLDIFFVVADTISVNRRLESLALVMRDELSRNNCIPNDIRGLFINQLEEINNSSIVMVDYDWNLDHPVTVNGVTYPPINEENVKNYGDQLYLVIVAKMRPRSLMFTNPANNNGSFLASSVMEYDRTLVYSVPALRYLK